MIWVIGGTKDSRLIVERLLNTAADILVTTTTDYGAALLPKNEQLMIKVGKLDKKEMAQIIEEQAITTVIDASHPYAIQVSKNVIDVVNYKPIQLYRYERQATPYPKKYGYGSYEDMIQRLNKTKGKVLLTTGSNSLEFWAKNFNIQRLVIRVLPTPQVIKHCRQLGFQPNQMIALQGPFSKRINKALISFKEIDYLVTKESGTIGGFKAKLEAALESSIEPLILKRPRINYYNRYSDIDLLLEELKKNGGH